MPTKEEDAIGDIPIGGIQLFRAILEGGEEMLEITTQINCRYLWIYLLGYFVGLSLVHLPHQCISLAPHFTYLEIPFP